MPDQQGFYSKLEEVIANKLPNLATPQQVLATVDPAKGSGVKAEELKWTEFAKTVQQLADQNSGKVPKDKLLKMINWLGKEMFREQTFSDQNHVRRYVVNDPFSSSTYDNLTDAEEARGDVVDFLRSDMEREWQIDQQEDGTFKITNNYGEPLRIQRDESGREVWAPERSYSTREEAEAALSEGAQTVADALVRVDEQKEATDGPEFEVWSLPGGEKYREVALVAPYVGAWKDRPTGHDLGRNADADVNTARVAHMRLKDRVDTAGRPGTFIEEIQSDRHQAGREKGYLGDQPKPFRDKDGYWLLPGWESKFLSEDQAIEAWKSSPGSQGVPDAPYRKDWGVQMFKRALRDAVRDGKTWIGWTTGETQADRYNLAKKIKLASAIANKDGTYNVVFEGLQGQEVPGYEGSGKKLTVEELGKTVGEELAKKLIEGADRNKDRPWPKGAKINPAFFTLRGMDLKVGGEGMKGFYDQILPSEIGKYVKQWGAKVEKGAITTPETAGQNARLQHELYDPQGNLFDAYETLQDAQNAARDAGPGYFVKSPERSVRTTIWRVDITPQMRESVQKTGQPRFMPQPDLSVPGAYSVTGGFRILPGKTAGRMRVYGPSGSLVGIAGSLDEAQRMIRKKTQSN